MMKSSCQGNSAMARFKASTRIDMKIGKGILIREQEKINKYLGTNVEQAIHHTKMKEKFKKNLLGE